jgi:hypothetical protein
VAAWDPYSGDEALVWPGSYEDYCTHADRLGLEDRLTEAEHDVQDAAFEAVHRSILQGTAEWDAIEPVARALLVWGPARSDRRPPGVADEVLCDAHLADIAEDMLPQVGNAGLDRVLGPWADEVLPRWVRVQAAAAMVFVPEVPPGVPSWARVVKRRPRPSVEFRRSVKVASRVPPMLYRVSGTELVPLLPLGRHFVPDGPVRGVPDAPAVIGRAVRGPDGLFLVAGMPLTRIPPSDCVERRLRQEMIRLRRRERRFSWEDMLRERSELLYRTCCEWLWLQLSGTDSPPW